MYTEEINFKVGMTCGGCASAVNRILTKIPGVIKVDANVETKSVAVTVAVGVEPQTLLDALLKWSTASGKSVELI